MTRSEGRQETVCQLFMHFTLRSETRKSCSRKWSHRHQAAVVTSEAQTDCSGDTS